MGVFKRQGVFWIDYYVNGHRKRERIGPDKRLADTVLRKRKVAIAEGKFLDKRKVPRCTFAELAMMYLEWAKTNHRGYIATRSRVKMLSEVFGNQQLSDITPLKVDTYVSERAAICKPGTVNRDVVVLRHMLNKAVEWGKALSNPVAHVKALAVPNHRLRFLSQDEIARLLDVADAEFKPLLITALHTGMRRGELFSLTWPDVDFKHGLVRVIQSKSGKSRDIPMNETLRETLQVLPRRIDSAYVFPGKGGKAMVDIKKRFHRTLREAGIAHFRFHDLRHTFASHLVMSGVDLVSVKEFLGHADLKMTLRYAHLAPHHKHEAISRLDTYMDTSHKKGVADYAATP
jgi:integrase